MLSYEQVAEAIEFEGRRIGKLAEECATIVTMAAECEVDFKVAFAKERMRYRDEAARTGAKATVDIVEDHATVETADDRRAYLVAQGSVTAIREALRAAQARLDGLRTLAAGYRQAGG